MASRLPRRRLDRPVRCAKGEVTTRVVTLPHVQLRFARLCASRPFRPPPRWPLPQEQALCAPTLDAVPFCPLPLAAAQRGGNAASSSARLPRQTPIEIWHGGHESGLGPPAAPSLKERGAKIEASVAGFFLCGTRPRRPQPLGVVAQLLGC
eukprot:2937319-Prymnesium_polylepis.1